MRLTHIDINMSNMMVTKIVPKHFLCTFWGFLVAITCDVKIDVNMCEPHYVNLFFLWTSSIVHVFDLLTFDIFLTTWHLFDNLTSFWQLDIFFDMWAMGHIGKWVSRLILKIEMGHLGGWGTWGMGHMGDGAHGQQDTWEWDMGNGVSWLILTIEMGYLGGWGTWPMGHMGNWAHDHNFLNTAWIFTKILLHRYWCILSRYTVICPWWVDLK